MMEPEEAVKIARNYMTGDPLIAPSTEELFEALETFIAIVDYDNSKPPLSFDVIKTKTFRSGIEIINSDRSVIATGVDPTGKIILKEC